MCHCLSLHKYDPLGYSLRRRDYLGRTPSRYSRRFWNDVVIFHDDIWKDSPVSAELTYLDPVFDVCLRADL